MGRRLQEAHRRLVQDELSDSVGEQGRLERADATVGMPEHVHLLARPLDDRDDVLELALERVVVRIAAPPAAAAVHRQDGEALL